jgi:hypothetical protein
MGGSDDQGRGRSWCVRTSLAPKLSYVAQSCHAATMRRPTNEDVEFTIVTILIIVAFANGIISGLMAL